DAHSAAGDLLEQFVVAEEPLFRAIRSGVSQAAWSQGRRVGRLVVKPGARVMVRRLAGRIRRFFVSHGKAFDRQTSRQRRAANHRSWQRARTLYELGSSAEREFIWFAILSAGP